MRSDIVECMTTQLTEPAVDSYYNHVNSWLTVGGDLDLAYKVTGKDEDEVVAELIGQGVTHVLDLRLGFEGPTNLPWVYGGLLPENWCHVPIDDDRSHTPNEEWFTDIEDFARRFWNESEEGDLLYVGCHMGINRGPTAAMVALLTVGDEGEIPTPFAAFLKVRAARKMAGLVYAQAAGMRHMRNAGATSRELAGFANALNEYWTPERRREVHYGISYYRECGA